MTLALEDKIILITGGGAGIGKGITDACVAAGATVVIGSLEDTSSVVPSERVDYQMLDVSYPQAIDNWVDAAVERYSRIDGVVANAGVTLTPDFLGAELADLEQLWTVNQRGVFLTAQAVARRMVSAETGGSIVTIASNHTRASAAGYEMYAATKAGIVAMSRAMAWSLGKHAIRVNSLSPGLTRTEAVSRMTDDNPQLDSVFRSWHATGHYNSVNDVGACAVFLLSDASASMTGTDLLADQGMSASLSGLNGL